MRPQRAFIIERSAERHNSMVAVILIEITSSHSSSFIRMARLSRVMPALFTRMLTAPVNSEALANRPSTSALSDRLAVTT